MYRIGVDVGGTNSDAAIIDITAFDSPHRGVLASHKAATTPDITSGIEKAIQSILDQSKVDKRSILSVTIGTTHFINALVEADVRRLDKVAVVRLCGAFTRTIHPFADFPVGLKRVLDGGAYFLDGGLEIDGREIAQLDHEQIRKTAREIVASGVKSVALVGIFAPLDHSGIHEQKCKEILLQAAPSLQVICSQDLGSPGLLERENATILNAAILNTAKTTIRGFKRAMTRLQLACPLYLSQNDGTLLEADAAAEHPIKTFASGPTNSMTGAAFLAGLDKPKVVSTQQGEAASNVDQTEEQVLVVDVGGTTTDVCALLPSGFPRQAPGFVEVGGIRTAFSMPEVVSIGLGGGSKIDINKETGEVTVGPGSIGHYLTTEALVFGGSTMTATDIAVASGEAELGDANLIKHLPSDVISKARNQTKKMIEGVVQRMKMSSAPVHVLLVGGGSLLVSGTLKGVDKVTKPPFHDAANAVGAAIAKVAGEVDMIEILEGQDEHAVVESACQKAIDQCIRKGADPRDVNIVEIQKIPLQYTSNRAIRLQVRAVGKLGIPEIGTQNSKMQEHLLEDLDTETEDAKVSISDALEPTTKPALNVDLAKYRPNVNNGTWYISEVDLELIATGAGVLGTGGGGPTHHDFLRGLQVLRSGGAGKMRVISPKALRDSDLICFGSWYGAPSVINERIAAGSEITTGIDALLKMQGHDSFDALFTDEIGGGNGLSAFPGSVHYDVPVVDGDGMGRAFPTMYHCTLYINGHSITPAALTDARGNVSIVMSAQDPHRVESLLRTTAIELGLGCAVCAAPLRGSAIKQHGVPNTISQAWYLGRAVHQSRKAKTSFVDAIFAVNPGKLLFSGKIIDVRRDVSGGYTMGSVLLAPLSDDERESTSNSASSSTNTASLNSHMIIPFQNEFLYAATCDSAGTSSSETVVCTVPELISILGQDGEAIGSQDLRYGLVVSVIAMPSHPLWKEPQGLKVGGPEGFGLKVPFTAVGEYTDPKSVIDEFGGDS
jgi:DUF917 family protein/N-methylhydantoinase A/oxoprolinase/acetone carboxylase beta subunit